MSATAISGSVILTAGGRYVNPLDLQPEDIDIEDIAHGLSRQARFSGHTKGEYAYSVAQHCALCLDLNAGLDVVTRMTTLLHDSSEAYLQDVARPLKEDPYFGKAYRGAERRAEKVIADVFDIPFPYPPEVKRADLLMLAAERRDLMPPNGRWEILKGVKAPDMLIVPWHPEAARRHFLKQFYALQYEREAINQGA